MFIFFFSRLFVSCASSRNNFGHKLLLFFLTMFQQRVHTCSTYAQPGSFTQFTVIFLLSSNQFPCTYFNSAFNFIQVDCVRRTSSRCWTSQIFMDNTSVDSRSAFRQNFGAFHPAACFWNNYVFCCFLISIF